MKLFISRYLTVSALMFSTLTSSIYAETPNLPKSTQVKTDKNVSDAIEIIPEIKIESGTASSNSKLKEGKTCNFDDLEEAEGEEFIDIPMAQTIPCADVDCQDLKAAVLTDDDYKDLKDAKTIAGCDK